MTNLNFKFYFDKYIFFLKNSNLYKKKNYYVYSASLEKIKNWKKKDRINKINEWYSKCCQENKSVVEKIKIVDLKDWEFDKKNSSIIHKSGAFYSIDAFKIINAKREVKEWGQPMITQVGYKGGVIGLLRKNFNGIPHYLVEAKFEPGNYNKIQISPSVQVTYSNLNRVHKGGKNNIYKYLNNGKTLVKKWVSEDGGRFMNKRNLHWIVESDQEIKIPHKNFKWLTLWEIKKLSLAKAITSPHLRAILFYL